MSKIASPYQTGGGGNNFEHRVQAAYLAKFLVNGSLTYGLDGLISEIRLQAKQEGYHTDDMLVKMYNIDTDISYKLLIQIKHRLVPSQNNKIFYKTIEAAWRDFNNNSLFNVLNDKIVLITGPLSEKMITHFRPMLDWARRCKDESEYIRKIESLNFCSNETRKYLDVIKEVIAKFESEKVSIKKLWSFVKCIYLESYDFDQQNSNDLEHILQLIKMHNDTYDNNKILPEDIWGRLIQYVESSNQVAGTITRETLPSNILECFEGIERNVKLKSDIENLNKYRDSLMSIIKDNIGNCVQLPRDKYQELVLEKFEENDAVFIIGEPMVGKTVLLKLLYNRIKEKSKVIMFSVKKISGKSLDVFLKSLNVNCDLYDILNSSKKDSYNYIFIDGLDDANTEEKQQIVTQIISIVSKYNKEKNNVNNNNDKKCKILFTCRKNEVERIILNLNTISFINENAIDLVEIQNLSENERELVFNGCPQLKPLSNYKNLCDIIWRPSILDIIALPYIKLQQSNQPEIISELNVMEWFWKRVIRISETIIEGKGNPYDRENLLLELAYSRALNVDLHMQVWNSEVFDGLIKDRILILDGQKLYFSHDTYEEWALVVLFDRKREKIFEIIKNGKENLFNYRPLKLLCQKLINDNELNSWLKLLEYFTTNVTASSRWRQAILSAAFESGNIYQLLERLYELHEYQVIKELLQTLRKYCVDTTIYQENVKCTNSHTLAISIKPELDIWEDSLRFALFADKLLCPEIIYELSYIVKLWIINIDKERDSNYIKEKAFDLFFNCNIDDLGDISTIQLQEQKENIIEIVLWSADISPNAVIKFINRIEDTNLKEYLYNLILDTAWYPLCNCMPKEAVEIITRIITKPQDYNVRYRKGLGIRSFGKKAPSYLGTPFLGFIKMDTINGLRLINNIVNYTTLNWKEREISNHKMPIPHEINVDGTKIVLWGDEHVYNWFRYSTGTPQYTTCALMALERWICEQIEEGMDPRRLFTMVMRETNSFAVIGVCTFVACLYYEKCIEAIQPIIEKVEFWHLDFKRLLERHKLKEQLDIGVYFGDIIKDKYYDIALELAEKDTDLSDISLYGCLLIHEYKKVHLLSIINEFPKTPPIFFEEEKLDYNEYKKRIEECEFFVSLANRKKRKQVKDDKQDDEYIEIKRFWSWTLQLFQQHKVGSNFSLESAKEYAFKLEKIDDINYKPFGASFEEKQVFIADSLAQYAAGLLLCKWNWVIENKLENWCKKQILIAARRPNRNYRLKNRLKKKNNFSCEAEFGYEYSAAISLPVFLLSAPDDIEVINQIYIMLNHDEIQIRELLFSSLKYLWGVNEDLIWRCFDLSIKNAIKQYHKYTSPIDIFNSSMIKLFPLKDTYLRQFWNCPLNCLYLYPTIYALPDFDQIDLVNDVKAYENYLEQMFWYTIIIYPKSKYHNNSIRQMSPNYNWEHVIIKKIADYLVGCNNILESRVFKAIIDDWYEAPSIIITLQNKIMQIVYELEDLEFISFINNWIEFGNVLLLTNIDALVQDKIEEIYEVYSNLLLASSPSECSLQIKSWNELSSFINFIEVWCDKVGVIPKCFNTLVRFLMGLGLNISYEIKVKWIHKILLNRNKEFLNADGARRLIELMYDIWMKERSILCNNQLAYSKFVFIVDALAALGEYIAVSLQKDISSNSV